MRSAVIYFSVSGNTEKVARAIAEALPGDVELAELGEAPPLEGCDLAFVGMPIHQFGAPEPVQEFLRTACQQRRVALFITHAAGEEMPELVPWLDACREAAAGCEVVGVFNCQGQVPPRPARAGSTPECRCWCSSGRWPAWRTASRTRRRCGARATSLARP